MKYPKFLKTGGHDASEFLQLFVEFTFSSDANSEFKNIFFLRTKSIYECAKCHHSYRMTTEEDSFYIVANLPDDADEPLDIKHAVHSYFAKEVLPEGHSFVCRQCQNKTGSRQRFGSYYPDFVSVLISRSSVHRTKKGIEIKQKTNPTSIPLVLSELVMGCKYAIHSIICHTGEHYYTLIKHPNTGKWYEFNDSKVSKIELSDLSVRNFPF